MGEKIDNKTNKPKKTEGEEELEKLSKEIPTHKGSDTESDRESDTELGVESDIKGKIPLLTDIYEFDSEGNFNLKVEIKEDEKGNYIEINGIRYYEENYNGLGYYIDKNGGIYLGQMKEGSPHGYGTKCFRDTNNGKRSQYTGERVDSLPKWKSKGNLTYYNERGEVESEYTGEVNANCAPLGEGEMKHLGGNMPYKTYKGHRFNGKRDGEGTCTFIDGSTYEGQRSNGTMKGEGICTYIDGSSYNGHRFNGIRDGRGTFTRANGNTYVGDWENDKQKEGHGTKTIKETGEIFDGDFLYDGDVFRPFCQKVEDESGEDIYVYQKWMKRKMDSGETESLSNINLHGEHTYLDGTFVRYDLTNGNYGEESNSFLRLFPDEKPNEDWSKERGNITYNVRHSNSGTEYSLSSREETINWTLDGGEYIFENKKGDKLSIKKSDDNNFNDDEHAKYAANLINSVKHINKNAHNNREYSYSGDELRATTVVPIPANYGCATSAAITAGPLYTQEINSTILISDVPLRFGKTSARDLAERLNGER